MNKKLICFVLAAMFLLPMVNCVQVSVKTSAGQYTEHLGAGIDDSIYGSSKITRDGLTNALWSAGTPKSKSSSTGNLNLAETHSVGSNTNMGAEVGVRISNAKSYYYGYSLYPGTSFVGAAEALDVDSAKSINAWARAYNGGSKYDVGVSTIVNNGNLKGYSNCAIASTDSTGAFQSFDTATGTIQVDSTARTLSSAYTSDVEQDTIPEASIRTKATGTISNYQDAAVKSSTGTSIEQNARIVGAFNSASTANDQFIARSSDYGTKYDIDMQANIANSVPSVKGTLTYYINPNLKIQGAVDKSLSGDVINVAAGTYNENVVIPKAVTVRGDNVAVTKVTNNGGKVYLNSMKVFIRADDIYYACPQLDWITNLVNSKDISATYAVIPAWTIAEPADGPTAVKFLESLDKSKFELATHGLAHEAFNTMDYSGQYNTLNSATNLMMEYFYRPRTFVAPYLATDANTIAACKALGYHTIVGDYVSGAQGITQLGQDFEWEKAFTDTGATHYTLDEFKTGVPGYYVGFDSAYNSGTKTYEIALHPWTFTSADDQTTFANSIDYMKGKTNAYGSGVEFMTMEEYYKYNN
ncbi:Uncharacterised protein [uncultured archaeon]|nr:Uncharacterised protein [uncultured archaeon]